MTETFPFLGELYVHFYSYPLYIQIALLVIVISIATLILTNAVIILQRLEYTYIEYKSEQTRKIITGELTTNLMLPDEVSDESLEKLAIRLRKLSSGNKLNSQLITDELIFYRRNLSGHTARHLGTLYKKLNFVKRPLKRLKKRAWYVKAEALRELQELPATRVSNDLLLPLLNSENDDLRIEAQAAYIRMNPKNAFSFLDTATGELLDWHQIILAEIIRNTPGLEIPRFEQWLDSPNSSVIDFSTKLIVDYQQLEAIPKILKLLDHPDLKIKDAAIFALGRLDAEQGEAKMIKIFPEETIPVKLKVLEAMGNIRSGNNLKFLTDQFLGSQEFSLIKTAGCALVNQPDFNPESILSINDLSSQHKAILRHCMNSIIRN